MYWYAEAQKIYRVLETQTRAKNKSREVSFLVERRRKRQQAKEGVEERNKGSFPYASGVSEMIAVWFLVSSLKCSLLYGWIFCHLLSLLSCHPKLSHHSPSNSKTMEMILDQLHHQGFNSGSMSYGDILFVL